MNWIVSCVQHSSDSQSWSIYDFALRNEDCVFCLQVIRLIRRQWLAYLPVLQDNQLSAFGCFSWSGDWNLKGWYWQSWYLSPASTAAHTFPLGGAQNGLKEMLWRMEQCSSNPLAIHLDTDAAEFSPLNHFVWHWRDLVWQMISLLAPTGALVFIMVYYISAATHFFKFFRC